MPDQNKWTFKCGHHFTLLVGELGDVVPSESNHHSSSRRNIIHVKSSPERCPGCKYRARQAERRTKAICVETEEAVDAHREHAIFLEVQIESAKNNAALKADLEKALDKSKSVLAAQAKYWATSKMDQTSAFRSRIHKGLRSFMLELDKEFVATPFILETMSGIEQTVVQGHVEQNPENVAVVRNLQGRQGEWEQAQREYEALRNDLSGTLQLMTEAAQNYEVVWRRLEELIRSAVVG